MKKRKRKKALPRVSLFWRVATLLRKLALLPGVLLLICSVIFSTWFYYSGNYKASIEVMESGSTAVYRKLGLVVSDIYLEGQNHQSVQSILDSINVKRDTPIFDFSVNDVRQKVEQLSWIEYAEVERVLPSTLVIRVLEREPLAIWQNKGKVMLIDMHGKEIPNADIATYKNLIILVGDDVPQYAGHLFELLDMDKELGKMVSSAIRVGGRRWNIRFYNNVEVKLPEDNMVEAWQELIKMQKNTQIINGDVLTIDLRLKDKMYINPG